MADCTLGRGCSICCFKLHGEVQSDDAAAGHMFQRVSGATMAGWAKHAKSRAQQRHARHGAAVLALQASFEMPAAGNARVLAVLARSGDRGVLPEAEQIVHYTASWA